ncbi:MAG: CvpA family protein [Firmicutes bacterium]|nr:CvpA family protein [Bacillota bacterium]
MNWLDGVILGGTALWAVRRARQGFRRVVLETGGAALGLYLAWSYGQSVARWTAAFGIPHWIGLPAAYAALVFVPAAAGHAAGQRAVGTGGVWNRLGGGLIGAVEALAAVGAGIVVWAQLGGPLYAAPIVDSAMAGWMLYILPALYRQGVEVLPR